jgi:hypothetical protein
MHSFRVRPRFFLWCLVFLAVYVAASALAMSLYIKELRTQKTQAALLQQLQREMEATRKEMYRSRQQLAMLEDHILGVPADANPEPKSEAGKEPSPERPDKAAPGPDVRPGETVAEVKGLSVKKAGAKLEVSLRLVNAHVEKGQLRGYLHIIAMDRGSNPPQVWTYPKAAMREGVPVDYRSGYLFSFRNFITVRGSMFLNAETDHPSHIHVLAYTESGETILDRQFEIS